MHETRGATAQLVKQTNYKRRMILVVYSRIRFEMWPSGCFKFIGFQWNNTGYCKRRRNKSARNFLHSGLSRKLRWRINNKRGGRASRRPMRGPFLISKERPPHAPMLAGGWDRPFRMRIRKRKGDHPRTTQKISTYALHWFPWDVYHMMNRAEEKKQEQQKK